MAAMEYDLSPASVVNAVGALLFAVAGVAILAIAMRSVRGRLVGAFCATFGVLYVVENLLIPGPTANLILALAAGATLVAEAFLIAHLQHGLWTRRALLVHGLILSALLPMWCLALVKPDLVPGMRGPFHALFAGLALQAQQVGLISVVASVAYRVRASQGEERRALSAFALAIGPYTALLWTGPLSLGVGAVYFELGIPSPLVAALFDLTIATVLVAALQFVHRSDDPREGLRRAVFPAIVVVAVAGLGLRLAMLRGSTDLGAFGIVRTVGLVFLAIAVTRHGLLGVPLPSLAARQGALATATLAIVFIVAQVAQNFLQTKYGLIIGGVMAGSFLFAAQPIQRLVESRAASQASATGRSRDGHAAEIYRRLALRLAADGQISSEDRKTLAYVAQEMGLGPAFVHDVNAEAEAAAAAEGTRQARGTSVLRGKR